MGHKQKYKVTKERPMSWSSLSSFQWDREQWYQNYYLGIKSKPSAAMEFGKVFAKSCEDRKPLAPVTLLSKMEQKFSIVFNGIPMIGFADTFDDVTFKEIGEYKTSGKPWTQKKVDEHGQITLYALFNFVTNKVRPEDCKFFLENVLTVENGDFSVSLKQPVVVQRFETKRSMSDILLFGKFINDSYKEMQQYVAQHD